jgi:hypothetical protein
MYAVYKFHGCGDAHYSYGFADNGCNGYERMTIATVKSAVNICAINYLDMVNTP